jgi:hypothetical protein
MPTKTGLDLSLLTTLPAMLGLRAHSARADYPPLAAALLEPARALPAPCSCERAVYAPAQPADDGPRREDVRFP